MSLYDNSYAKTPPPITIFLSACSIVPKPIGITPIGDDLIIIESPHGFEMFFDSGATHTARDLYTPGSTVINGSYFGVTDSEVYYPSGLWIENGEEKSLLQTDDYNLSHVVYKNSLDTQIFSNSYWSMKIKSTGSFIDAKFSVEDQAFQAGPLILSGGIIQDFSRSWHANGRHERTLIGVTQSGKVYFFISRKQLSLTEIGEQILHDTRFGQDPITVLNLDGGPSTAYYDGTHGFREDTKLPIFFRINP